jgi:hypothetical protein
MDGPAVCSVADAAGFHVAVFIFFAAEAELLILFEEK